jgi:hypothetical protein
MRVVVFLGPSLPAAQARRILPGALVLPPCAMGDVLDALNRHTPDAIAIVDGLFERTPSVWHKEILYALAQGVAVFGGGSMGALRAAELHPFGMRGVGRIFEDFAQGRLEDDDEVAVTHLSAADGYRPMCEPMVNLRYGLELALDAGLLDATQCDTLVAAMKRVHYPERSWDVLFQQARALGIGGAQVDALERLVQSRRPDRKAEDAVAVLEAVRAWQHERTPPPAPRPAFEPTVFWDHLASERADVGAAGQGVSQDKLIDYVRLGVRDRERVLDEALRACLVRHVCRLLGTPAVDDEAAMARFRRERGLAKPQALRAWMQSQGLDATQCLALARDEERLRLLHWRFQEEVSREIPRVLQRHGRLHEVVDAVRAQAERLAALGIGEADESDVESMDEVLQWYLRRWGPVHTDLPAHIVERGFGSPRHFMRELVARYLAQHAEPTDPATSTRVGGAVECAS